MFKKPSIFTITSFLTAFLLFSIQPLFGKYLLPQFGGSASIWTVSMFFFITLNFLGNVFLIYLVKQNSSHQRSIYTLLFYLSFFTLALYYRFSPINLAHSPQLSIVATLLLNIGFPYFILSTTNAFIQHRFTQIFPTQSPYFLYTIANLGALVGLVAYPLFIDQYIPLNWQKVIWIFLFTTYCLLLKVINNFQINFKLAPSNLIQKAIKSSATQKIKWFILALVPNLLLLTVTTYLTQALTPIPLLWIIPLALYLISYILGFSERVHYHRGSFSLVLFILICVSVLNLHNHTLLIICAFIASLVFHKELYLARPHKTDLGLYYTYISGSGVVAAIFCSIIAPLTFSDIWEFPLSLLGASLLLITLQSSKVKAIYFLSLCFIIYTVTNRGIFSTNTFRGVLVSKERSFYGVNQVYEKTKDNQILRRDLFIGKIHHGFQVFGSQEYEPSDYYGRSTGIGLAIDQTRNGFESRPLKIATIGLGVGTIAGYCRPNDYFKFYEIDPTIINYSTKYFTYINRCKEIGGKVEITAGDARQVLTTESKLPQNKFDIFIVDAFNGTSIPTHLLTQEAIKLYLANLSDDGYLAIHITNPNIQLQHILNQVSHDLALYTYFYTKPDTSWYFISPSNRDFPFHFTKPIVTKKIYIPWTDNHNNVLKLLSQ